VHAEQAAQGVACCLKTVAKRMRPAQIMLNMKELR